MYFKSGKLLIISAPSGSGKTTIAKFLLSQNLNYKKDFYFLMFVSNNLIL